MSKSLKALVPVRSGSLRVPNKNLKPFCGSNLLEIRVKQLLELEELDGVVVSSNDPQMLEIARRLGAEVHQRDEYFASNTVSMSEVYKNMAESINCENIMYTLVTTPLVTSESFKKAISSYLHLSPEHDSVTTVADVKDFLLLDGKAINYDQSSIPRSQDLPEIVKLTFGISILPRTTMIKKRSCLGHSPSYIKLSALESIDIDTSLDFEIAEFLYSKL